MNFSKPECKEKFPSCKYHTLSQMCLKVVNKSKILKLISVGSQFLHFGAYLYLQIKLFL